MKISKDLFAFYNSMKSKNSVIFRGFLDDLVGVVNDLHKMLKTIERQGLQKSSRPKAFFQNVSMFLSWRTLLTD